MVADNSMEREDIQGQPMFDSANVVNWVKKLMMWLMRKKRNHLGLEHRLSDLRTTQQQPLEQNTKRVLKNVWSAIYETVQHVPDALEIVDQYILEKKILPAGDLNKDVLASELLQD